MLSARLGQSHAPGPGVDAGVARRGRGEDHLPLDLGPVVGDDDVAIELRMDHRQVITLEIVLDVGLPVAGEVVAAPLDQRKARQGIGAVQRSQRLGERGRGEVEVDEHQALPGLHADGEEAVLARVEPGRIAEVDGVAQPAVQGVAPAVVAAGEALAAVAKAVGHQGAGAVAADVVEGGQVALGLAHQHHRRAADQLGQVVAGTPDHGLVADELPGAPQDRGAVRAQGLFAAVEIDAQHGVSDRFRGRA